MTTFFLLALSAAAAVVPRPPASLADCDAWVLREPESLGAYRCYWTLARQNQAAPARRRLEALLSRPARNPRACLFLARIEGDQGRDRAETLYREAIAGLRTLGEIEGAVLGHSGLSVFLSRRHRAADAEAAVAEAARLAEASGDALLRARVRNDEGWQAFWRGDLGRAWTLFKEVEAVVFPDGPLDLRALCVSGLGGVSQETGRIEASFEYIRRQAELHRQDGDFYDEARARGNLVLSGFRLSMQDRMEAAEVVDLARQALAAAIAGGNRGTEARAHLYLGDLTTGAAAREHYRQGLAISRETGEVAGLILGLRGLALNTVESERHAAQAAERSIDEAVHLARGSNFYTAIAALARARMRWRTGPRDRAIEDSEAALKAIEAIRDLQHDGLVRARVFSMWAFAYHRMAGEILASAGPPPSPEDLERAFGVVERMRARVLLDELDAAQATGALLPAGSPLDRRGEVLKRIAEVQRSLLSPALDRRARSQALSELERLEREDDDLRVRLARAHPEFEAWRRPPPPTLRDLQGALGEDEALVSFQVASRRNVDNRTTDHGSWLWLHLRSGTRVHPIPDQAALRPAVALFLGLIERRDGSEAAAAAQLYQTLLAPALRDLPSGVRRLWIVPDAALHRLPFHALRASPHEAPLGLRYSVGVLPSAALFMRWRRVAEVSPGEGPALVVADPDIPAATARAAVQRAWLGDGPLPGPLPHARGEAQSIVRLLGGGQVFMGDQASERRVKQTDLSSFPVLHLATHALLDEDHPDRSAILLAPGADDEDGLLQIREIVGLPLRDRAVVLSACRSASGTLLEGEGVMGLARGFFQAGARTVVGSLWPLRDEEASAFMRDFYGHLARGTTVGAALMRARQDQVRSGAPAAAWAGFVALGDVEVVPVPGGRSRFVWPSWPWWAMGLATLTTGAFASFWWRRERPRPSEGPRSTPAR